METERESLAAKTPGDRLLAAGSLRKAADGLEEAWGVSQGSPGEYWRDVPVTLGPQSF